MEIDEINELVRRVLFEIQKGSGRPFDEITDELCPIGGLEGFDSLNAVEASGLLSDYLEYKVPSNLMFVANSKRKLTIGEITERLYQIVNAKGG